MGDVCGKVPELQDTLDRNSSSLAQLECDKSEAHTRLDELDQQRNKLDAMLTDVKSKVQEETENIKSLRAKISAQEASVGQQEVELRRVRGELAKMKNEEMQLEQRLEAGKQQQATVDRSIDEASNDIKKVQGQIQKLQDQQKTVESNIKQYDQAVAAIKSESTSDFAFDELNSASMNNMAISESVFSMGAMQEKVDDIKQDINDDIFKQIDDPFKSSDPFEGSDPFAETDPFSSSATPAASSDPFAGADPFASSVGGLTPTPTSDPFNPGDFPATSSDPFKPGDFPSSTSDPFKPGDFGADVFPQTTETQTDPFGGQDPFATTKSSGFDTTLSSASSFAHDPFSSSEVFSGGEQPKITDSSKPTSVATTFDSGSFAAAFSDNGNTGKEDFFSNAFPTSNPTETKSTSDPWGSAFGGGAAFPAAEGDPFGGDSFTTPTQSDGFGKSTFTPDFSSMGKSKEPSKAPPRPAKPAEMSTKGVSEAEQLRWARDESRKAEEERRKLQLQEQADLELAIALSKQP